MTFNFQVFRNFIPIDVRLRGTVELEKFHFSGFFGGKPDDFPYAFEKDRIISDETGDKVGDVLLNLL